MTNATLRGKPDAGNPHVRFDEGEVASAKPRRGSLLYKCVAILSLGLALAVRGELDVYPDYPAAIERDDAYRVTVTQGAVSKPLVVWNHCEKSILNGRTHGGDVNRRFCEFAFGGDPVRVDIAVSEDVKAYKIFPARLGLKHAFKDGIVSVWLEKPENFGLQLNDYDKTILTVLGDPLETDVPAKGRADVCRIEGWVDAPGPDGTWVVSNGVKEVYLAPGSVLNARLYVRSANCRVHGRGMVLDPLSNIFRFDQSANRKFGTFSIEAPGVTAEDVKLVDARTFNLILLAFPNVTVRNMKIFSSMMCSDGMSFWGNSKSSTVVDHCWIYSGDNGLVISGTSPLLVKDTVVGTSCAAIFPQSNTRAPILLENVSVFRSDEGLINNYYNGNKPPQERPHNTQHVCFRNFTAVDTTQFAWIFQGRNMGHKPKTFIFDNASFPEPSGQADYRGIGKKGCAIKLTNGRDFLDTDNYTLVFTNLFVGGVAYPMGLPPDRVFNARTNTITYASAPFHGEVPLKADRTEVNWKCPPARRRALPHVAEGANLVAETLAAHSVWQRCPSYRTRLESYEEAGTRVYRVSRTQPDAGMQANLTEKVLAQGGTGTYVLTCEVKVVPAEGQTVPVPFVAQLLSNETAYAKKAMVGTDWTRLTFEFAPHFDVHKTGLVSLFLKFPKGVAEGHFRHVSFVKRSDR